MQIHGIDFTSAPSHKKPIVCASFGFEDGRLFFQSLLALDSFDVFENFLSCSQPWVAGFDFPFSIPRTLVESLAWPTRWQAMVEHVNALGAHQFGSELAGFAALRSAGDKFQYRQADRLVGALSPMMLHGVPVGKLFFQGAPRLAAADVSVMPCRVTRSPRVAVETYPALVARRILGKQSYKSDDRVKQTEQHLQVRARIVEGLLTAELTAAYGCSLQLPEVIADELIEDASGDALDAVLCAIQAAWTWTQAELGFGVPVDADPLEGWILDPALLDILASQPQ